MKSRLRIWTPTKPRYRCNVTVAPGELCGETFFADQEREWIDHVNHCAREHADTMRAAHAAANPEFLKPFDPEYAEWVKDHGRIG